MLRKQAEKDESKKDKDESKKEKDENIDDETKDVEINENREVVETENDKLVTNAANNAPPPLDALTITTTTETASEEGVKDDSDVADYTKGREDEGDILRLKREKTNMTKRT